MLTTTLLVLALDAILASAAPQGIGGLGGLGCGPLFSICPMPIQFSFSCSCYDNKNETTYASELCEKNGGKSYFREFPDGAPLKRNVCVFRTPPVPNLDISNTFSDKACETQYGANVTRGACTVYGGIIDETWGSTPSTPSTPSTSPTS